MPHISIKGMHFYMEPMNDFEESITMKPSNKFELLNLDEKRYLKFNCLCGGTFSCYSFPIHKKTMRHNRCLIANKMESDLLIDNYIKN